MRGNFGQRTAVGVLFLAFLVSVASADVKLPGVFSQHMVMQRDAALPVWGWAESGEKVTVTLGDRTATARADGDGKWSVKLDAVAAGGPHTLKIQGNNTVEIADILIGEVWLCSGQSNMAMTVARCRDQDAELASAKHPRIRMMTVARTPADTPRDNCGGEWIVCSPETVGSFSATAYFFGRHLHKELGVPVGLINSSWGGTPVQSWTDLKTQRALPRLESLLKGWEDQISA